MIHSIQFENFRALKNYKVNLKVFNVLVGPNNSGKSTVLDALRLFADAYRSVARRKPERVQIADDRIVEGWRVPVSAFAIGTENIHSEYTELPTIVRYSMDRGKQLVLSFSTSGSVTFHMEMDGRIPRTAKRFREVFPESVAIVPTLGPLDREEFVVKDRTVQLSARGHRAPRYFRNLWHHEPEKFEAFKDLLEKSWPGTTIQQPEHEYSSDNKLVMFMSENRMLREVAWAGFGFQIWIQLLTHLVRSDRATMIVVDEPEIYLHPDLQRKIVNVLRDLGPAVVLATHSVEVINEVEPNEVLLIERGRRDASRLSSLPGLDRAIELLGSSQNMHLTRLSRGKRILFVEGQDRRILKRLASKAGYGDMFEDSNLTVIPLKGFAGYERIEHAQWAFESVLGAGMSIGAVFDRDYRCDDEIESVISKLERCTDFAHIFSFKELENYLLVPELVKRCIDARLKYVVDSGRLLAVPQYDAQELLMLSSDSSKNQVVSQLTAHRYRYHGQTSQDLSQVVAEVNDAVESDWQCWDTRKRLVPGKSTIAILNRRINDDWGVSITSAQLASAIRKDELLPEIAQMFKKIHETMLSDT